MRFAVHTHRLCVARRATVPRMGVASFVRWTHLLDPQQGIPASLPLIACATSGRTTPRERETTIDHEPWPLPLRATRERLRSPVQDARLGRAAGARTSTVNFTAALSACVLVPEPRPGRQQRLSSSQGRAAVPIDVEEDEALRGEDPPARGRGRRPAGLWIRRRSRARRCSSFGPTFGIGLAWLRRSRAMVDSPPITGSSDGSALSSDHEGDGSDDPGRSARRWPGCG